ncbi:putative leucine-rich repeat receptor-like protein kinase IMK3 [Primulina tabacum]|uniref:putative leucine-rich repeat receptor-like protein kinase IMK3 n=1 Tax=Primulina tabacum TaxID=48773 RepID=UPI003F5AC629
MGVPIQEPFRNGPVGFSGCPSNGNTGRGRGDSDTKIENWSKPHLLLCIFLVLFSGLGLVSGEKWDGVIVTQADYQALQAIKHELVDSKGVLKSWNDTSNGACSGEWTGIKCVNGQVIAIQLPWKGLGGRISENIGQLQALRRLSLHDNFLVGPVPTSLGFLPNLRGIYLFNNRLSGSIPPSIGNCLVLQTLDLSNNQLTGTIPPSIANSSRLYRFNLSFNGISGYIPSTLSQNPSLTFLALQNNNLSGSIPDSWSSKNSNHSYNLQSLNLSYNRINGNIPEEFGNLLKLNSLDLSNNAITGTFPLSLTDLSSLATINLENNNLYSQIPESVGNLRNLSVLNLSSNRFKGQIPGTIGNITTLTFLDLSLNNLSMEIPTSLVNLPHLDTFNVSYNNLSGTVPSILASRFSSSSFIGNIQLCGYSSSTSCTSLQPKNLPSPKKHLRKLSSKDIILICAGALLIVLLILCCVLICCLIRKKAASRNSKAGGVLAKATPAAGNIVESGSETGGKLVHFDGPFVFTADDLLCATAEIMGKSSYGTAYKATLEDNNVVAVKRLREKITKPQNEFEIEVSELGKIRHPNILALRAYYLGPKGEKLLVYDYMPNGSLASFLHARGPETNIQWPKRMAIAIGITQGLCYLHTEQDIVHGHLTSSNVLLDEQNNPEIADVGLSRLMTSAANMNIVATAGTMGYRAPELSKIKNATTKTDVFSLGVLLLELLTGKSPSEATDGLDLPQWVASTVKDEWNNEVFDVELLRDAPNIGDELLNTLKLALHCVDPSPTARPEAHQVLQKLEEIKPEMDTKVILPASGDGTTAAVETKVE